LTSGGSASGSEDAASLPALSSKLASHGAQIETAAEEPERLPNTRGIPYFEIIGIYRQMGSALDAGLPLPETLQMLSRETGNPRLGALLSFLRAKIAEGLALSEAMRLLPRVFPPVHIAVVRAGEESGRLEQVLLELADQAEALSNMNRRFASALVYPTVIALAALLLFNFVLFGIVPRFAVMFNDLGMRDLAITSLVLLLSHSIFPGIILIALGVLIAAGVVLTHRRASSGRLWLDSWKLRIPLAGQIVEKAALARFSGTMGLLLNAGIDLPRAIRLASEGAGNRAVEHLLKNVSAEVEMGNTLSEAAAKTETLPPTLAWRLGVGEETGSLPDALIRIGKLYTQQVESLVISAAGIIEPLLILAVGLGVGMLVIGMLLPLVSVISMLAGG
jgi:type IV pilus assembly protein PilC